MKDTRKLSVIYFAISLVLLLMVCFGCEANGIELDYIHHVNDYEVFYSDDFVTKDELKEVADYLIENGHNNFVIQSDLGIIEVENGEIIYNNIK